ncbi:hypothetical protein [Pseudonocardia humida]|uniref:Integral membrane protein n=1 Tax=Pseudonocardia humida TaxID=2800819 RepID=A0ABT1AAT9_9PSEU|nr:hypothetical protein [Pseudonocardia humida]MCO1660150.1 hypothetical protein [Pseudonocardia humida]
MTTSTSTSTTPSQRGAALTTVLAIAMIQHAVVVAVLVTAWSQDTALGQQPTPVLLVSAVGATVSLVAYAGLWTGYRWAFWLFIAMSVVAVATMVAVGAPPLLTLLQLVVAVALAAAVLRRWSHLS